MAKFEYHRRLDCRACGGADLTPYLDLGEHPPSNAFIDSDEIQNEQAFPLKLYFCHDCGLSQLLDVVHGTSVFDDYLYLSSTSKALVKHYHNMVQAILEDHKPQKGSLVIDVGANDGVTLDRYPVERFRLLGVEPSTAGNVAKEKGHLIEPVFFDEKSASQIREKHGPAYIITATNVCAHVDDILSFMKGFEVLLDDEGVVVFEFPYLIDMIDELYFDTIYHEHLCYYSLHSISRILKTVGLEPIKVERVDIGASGPALRLRAAKAGKISKVDGSVDALMKFELDWGVHDLARYQNFASRVDTTLVHIRRLIDEAIAEGKKIGAYTAPAKGSTLLNCLGFGSDTLKAVAENNEWKIGKLTPGTHIPIISDDDFLVSGIDLALLLSWNYANFFVEESHFSRQGGAFLIPLPEPRVICRYACDYP